MERTYLFSRRFAGEEYKFYIVEANDYCFICVETPANGFGYTDTIRICPPDIFQKMSGLKYGYYSYHRHHPKWIMERIAARLYKEYQKRGMPV